MATWEAEYLRRMKALGYEPSLAGMDDDDIEWELGKMEEAERRRETPPQQPLRTVYRPVDSGLKASANSASHTTRARYPRGRSFISTVGATDLAKEVEKEALAQGDGPELAKKKVEDSMGRYYVWQAAVLASTRAAGSKWGTKGAAIAGAGGTLASRLSVKDMIKKQVLGNTEDDYNTMFPGNVPLDAR